MRPALPKSEFYAQCRWGRVAAVKKAEHRLEVKFEEGEGFTSWDMPFLVQRPGDYAIPPVDTPVLCLIQDGALGIGFVLGCFYTDNDSAPLDDAGKRSIVSDDLRLGAHDADQKVALADLVKDRLDKLQDKFDNHTHIITVTSVDGDTATAATPASKVGALEDVAAEKVSAK